MFFFFNDTATTEIYTLSLHDALPIYGYEDEARTIQDLYLDGRKDEAAAVVPEELVRAVSLVGPESHVTERVAAFREAGVTTLVLQPLDDSPESRLRTVETMRKVADR